MHLLRLRACLWVHGLNIATHHHLVRIPSFSHPSLNHSPSAPLFYFLFHVLPGQPSTSERRKASHTLPFRDLSFFSACYDREPYEGKEREETTSHTHARTQPRSNTRVKSRLRAFYMKEKHRKVFSIDRTKKEANSKKPCPMNNKDEKKTAFQARRQLSFLRALMIDDDDESGISPPHPFS